MLAFVPAVDEGADLAGEVAGGGEGAAADGLAFDDAELDLDQVQPGAGGRGEVDVDPGICGEPGLHLRGLVGGVVQLDLDPPPTQRLPQPAGRITANELGRVSHMFGEARGMLVG